MTKKTQLDREERETLESFEKGEWRRVSSESEQIEEHRQTARRTLRKDRRVNIRISSRDLESIQAIAAEHAIPYQTLMASILHRYVSGSLVDQTRRTP